MGLLSKIRGTNGAKSSLAAPPSRDELVAELDSLMAANRDRQDPGTSRRILRLRHQLGADLIRPAVDVPPFPEPAFDRLPPENGLPEFGPAKLNPALLRAAILRDGCMLVRGVVDREVAIGLAGEIKAALDARQLASQSKPTPEGRFEVFEPNPPYDLAPERGWVNEAGGIWAADAPQAMYAVFDEFERAGLHSLISGYLGERPAISVNKCTFRRVAPDAGTAWHQDGAFLGDVRALNVWMALTHCGTTDSAPGMDLIPRRLEEIVPTGTEGATFGWSVSPQVAEEVAGEKPIVRPTFEPGDVLLFDEMFLHATAADPAMPNHRYAVESWFFGPTGFPKEYVPLAF